MKKMQVKLSKLGKTPVLFFLIVLIFISESLFAQRKPAKLFPDFMKQKENIKKIWVLGDVLHLQDIKGDIDVFEFERTQYLWDNFVQYFKPLMEKKNYYVEKYDLTSMGLYVDLEKKVYLEMTDADKQMDNQDLQKGSPPFYVNAEVEKNPEYKEKLTALYKKLNQYEKKPGDSNILVPEAQELVQGTDCDTLFVVTLLGRTISAGKIIGAGVVSGFVGGLTGALLGEAILTSLKGVIYGLYIIDIQSGELIWTHKFLNDEAIITKGSMKRVAKVFARPLPYKIGPVLEKAESEEEPIEEEKPEEPEAAIEEEKAEAAEEEMAAEEEKAEAEEEKALEEEQEVEEQEQEAEERESVEEERAAQARRPVQKKIVRKATPAEKKFTIAIKGGPAFATLGYSFADHDEADNKTITGFQIGVSFGLNISSRVTFQPEIFYSAKGTKFEEIDTWWDEKWEYFYKLNYLDIPLLFSYAFTLDSKIQPGLIAGPYFAVKTSAKEVQKVTDLDDGDVDIDEEKSDVIKTLDYGLVFGGFLKIKIKTIRLVLDVRYNLGLANIWDHPTTSARNRVFVIMIGFFIL